jgi:hypothetical protein
MVKCHLASYKIDIDCGRFTGPNVSKLDTKMCFKRHTSVIQPDTGSHLVKFVYKATHNTLKQRLQISPIAHSQKSVILILVLKSIPPDQSWSTKGCTMLGDKLSNFLILQKSCHKIYHPQRKPDGGRPDSLLSMQSRVPQCFQFCDA